MPKVTELTTDTTVSGAEILYCVDGTTDKQVAISTVRQYMLPSGVIQMCGMAAAPSGWLLCDGSAVSRTTYANLFTAIGTTFGVGDGVTTFNLPDFKGRVPLGVGTGDATDATAHTLAEKEGAETHTLTTTQMPAHTHSGVPSYTLSQGDSEGSSGRVTGNKSTNSTGGGAAHNNLQPSLGINFIIKT